MAKSVRGVAGWALLGLALLGSVGYAARDHLSAGLPGQASGASADDSVATRPAAQPVRVTHVTFSPVAAASSYTGVIRPQQEAQLGFRVPGKLIARTVEVGDQVSRGQILARLDETDARLDMEAAAADLAAARTELSRTETDALRARNLFADGHIARAALDRAISAEAEAQARADRADRARALAGNRLGYATLTAEADGVVTATLADAGQVLAAGQPVVSVARTGALDVVFALPEQDRDRLLGAVAHAELWAGASKGQSFQLRLRDIAPDADPTGRTYRVRMSLTAPVGQASLGRTVTVWLAPRDAPTAAAQPLAAVINEGAGPMVWRLVPGKDRVERVPVVLTALDDRTALVTGGGLAQGDVVISLGAHKIDPARPVRVVETTPVPES